MGPQVKTGTHSVRQGTPSVPVAALARGEPCHPSSVPRHPSFPPSVHPLTVPPLTLVYHAESPRNAPPSRSPSVPSLIHPQLPLHFPPTFPPTLPPFASPPPISLPFLSISNQSSIYDTSGEIIKLSYICDEPCENKGYCFNCLPMTSNYAYQCISLIFGENEANRV